MATRRPRRRRYPLPPGELRSSRLHDDEVFAVARHLYLRALEKHAPDKHDAEARRFVSGREVPPIGLLKPQDDQVESRRRRLRRWLAYLDRAAARRGRLSPIEYEEPPDYYPDEQRPKQYERDLRAYMRRQEQRYLEAGFVFEKGRATWGSPVFEAYALHRDATPRLSESEIAKKLGVTRQRVSQWLRQAARALHREGEVLPPLPSRPGPRKRRTRR